MTQKHRMERGQQGGFMLIELLVVVSIIGMLSSVTLVSLKSARAGARDARRMADIQQLANALALYQGNTGDMPPMTNPDLPIGGWEISTNPNFLQPLTPTIVASSPKDPVNVFDSSSFSFFGPKAGSYYYAYYLYTPTNAAYFGCDQFPRGMAVIAIHALERGPGSSTPSARCGTFPSGGCPLGGVPYVCRDWSSEYDTSIILGR